ncbi:hypothetical protein [Deinococcus aquaedulcis]|uniref:hypothetical protein n=1 Tax=Deinococcus aquaedulcis TaxID=2840455 RepID=UPI001C83FBDF|nr:hypothetical protein [Deinococcus aquaedulcis]
MKRLGLLLGLVACTPQPRDPALPIEPDPLVDRAVQQVKVGTAPPGQPLPISWEVRVHSCEAVTHLGVSRVGHEVQVRVQGPPSPQTCTTEAAHWERMGMTLPAALWRGDRVTCA